MIKHLRTAEFKPFVVFVRPPMIDRLRETRQNAKFVSGKDDKESAKPFKVRETLIWDYLYFIQSDAPEFYMYD